MKIRRFLILVGLVLVVVAGTGLQPRPAEALERSVIQKVLKSAVQIIAADEGQGGKLTPKWGGSGTIISSDGLILTNCHVALPQAMGFGDYYVYDLLVVALTIRSDEPPQPTYLAQVVQYDPELDLAVIRVTHTMDGSPVKADKLNLPALAMGDSDELEIGDKITIFGYPSIGGDTITLTSGNVSGFSRERGIDGRAWIKTDATIAGGNSGGTAVDEKGFLIGVPTQGGSGTEADIVDCRYIADTNGDGVVNDKDSCVPMGGFINALRPVNLAQPLIEAASRGLAPQPAPTPQPRPTTPTGKASISRPIFAPAVNEADQPVTVVDSFPSGTEEIYLLFDYQNFQDGAAWQPVLIVDGEVYNDVWPLSNWDGGPQGVWWISIYNDPLPDGAYKFEFYYDAKLLTSASVRVGGKPQRMPTFSNLVFRGGGEKGYILPGGIDKVEATFQYENTTSSTKWSYIWYYEGEKVADGAGQAFSRSTGTASASLTIRNGFEPGSYRLELYIGSKLAATSDFLVGGERGTTGEDLFGPVTFAEGVDRQDNPVKPGTSFKSGISALYAFFDYQGMQDGWRWIRRWYIDGEAVLEKEEAWEGGESGNWWIGINNGDQPLPDGEYALELLVEGQVIQTGECVIGTGGGRPTPTPTPQDGVEVYGRITDADTGRGIPGAIFLVLKPGITVDDFGWTEEEVYSFGEADRNGYYELSAPLVRGETYSMIIGAQGYKMVAEDDVTVGTDLESPFELNITLQKGQ